MEDVYRYVQCNHGLQAFARLFSKNVLLFPGTFGKRNLHFGYTDALPQISGRGRFEVMLGKQCFWNDLLLAIPAHAHRKRVPTQTRIPEGLASNASMLLLWGEREHDSSNP
jgi:hypothetical protein